MSIQQYTITKAEKAAGDPDKYGNVAFWLDIENHGRALVRRKPDSPVLQGPTWGEIEEATSKSGKAYKRFHVKKAPETNGNGASANVSGSTSDRIRWQTCLKVAGEVHSGNAVTADAVIEFARKLFAADPIIEAAKEIFNATPAPDSDEAPNWYW